MLDCGKCKFWFTELCDEPCLSCSNHDPNFEPVEEKEEEKEE